MATPAPAKRMKATPLNIGTHNGHFHADEALAVYMLRLLPEYKDATLTRSRDPAVLEECDIIVDVTGKYDGTKHFDHHQREFAETFSPNHKTKLSSAGLVYKHFARAIINHRLSIEPTSSSSDLIYTKLYNDFIEALDANDNGISAYPSDAPSPLFNEKSISLPSAVGAFNPNWNDPSPSQESEDANFVQASDFIGSVFLRKLDFYGKSWLPARDLVVAAIEKRMEYDDKGRILVFERSIPWRDHLFTIEEEKGIKGEAIYVLYGEGPEKNWRVQAVPVSKDSFESRKALPAAWRGIRDDALSEVTGVPGGVFVHASGFIGGNKSFEGALELAKKALEL
ncbi:uncharacterized protein H6S33_009467 [Morchella sextelata]|uniref:uncharacterized protein n=1 Tax=Morchella sextelata TaxID=1174677 RepID=UPI001D047446|nr:uncharacterized protein H6S33_009467 [Morchella sextelata]KAH0613087.1 hypothetical protein H6S33_009467 [Morchella sextelata]